MSNTRATIRSGLLMLLACSVCLPVWAASQHHAHPRTFTHYVGGCWQIERWEALKAEEAYAAEGGHQPWRQEPTDLASVYAHDLLPPDFVQGEAD